MSAVTEEATGRTRSELLRRSEAEWERKKISLIAEIDGLDAEIPELRRAAISKAPTQEPGLSVGTMLPRKIRTRNEKRRALENTRENLAAARALIVEVRQEEREDERQRLIAKAGEFDARERAAWEKVVQMHGRVR